MNTNTNPINKTLYDEMAIENELYSYGTKFSNDIFFKLDILKKDVMFLGSNLKRFKNKVIIPNYLGLVDETNLVHHDDVELFKNTLDDIEKGIATPLKFRVNNNDGEIVWYHAQYEIVKDEKNTPISAIGKINNIQESQDLKDKANLDLLTGCLNKKTFENWSNTLISNSTNSENISHAFFIIDIDNFKAINDNLGHFFGDIVLKEVSIKIKNTFRDADFIGRIGGDEFAVLMKNIEDINIVSKKADELITVLNSTYKGKNSNYKITGSIGISTFPNHGTTYAQLFQKADSALYNSKFTGKNSYTLFNEKLSKGTMVNTTPFDVANRALAHFYDQEITMNIFNILFDDEDYENSIMAALGHIGEKYNVDRCYIFELSNDSFDSYDNTYEWCSDGVEPQIDFLQNVDKELFLELFANANEENLYYCNDLSSVKHDGTRETLAIQGIKSFLHSYVKKNNLVNCVVGFDDCTSERIWTPREISTLSYSSKIIAQFLSYKRALSNIKRISDDNLHVIDSLNFFSYIVDIDDHTLKYVNNTTKKLLPDAEIGQTCHNILRGNISICKDCPVKMLHDNPNLSKVKLVIHNDILDTYFLVTASRLYSYDGREGVFVSSTDISELVDCIPVDKRDFSNCLVVE